MTTRNDYIDLLVKALRQSDPYRIILFGSYAKGTATEDSDIDMVVILNNDNVAKTYEEKIKKTVCQQACKGNKLQGSS